MLFFGTFVFLLIAQISNPTAEFAIHIAIPTEGSKVKFETTDSRD